MKGVWWPSARKRRPRPCRMLIIPGDSHRVSERHTSLLGLEGVRGKVLAIPGGDPPHTQTAASRGGTESSPATPAHWPKATMR